MAAVSAKPLNSERFQIRQWNTENGLPQNRISAVKQTRDGYLWLGTWFGLVRFDGVRFTVFNHANTPELVSETIDALAEDTSGTLWIGTKDGLLSYRDRHFNRFGMTEGLPNPVVFRVLSSRSGGIWLHAGSFVTRVDEGRFSRIQKVEFNPAEVMISVSEAPDGLLNVFKNWTWMTLGPKANESKTNYAGPGPRWLAAMATEKPDAFWIGTAQGLRQWHNGSLRSVEGNLSVGQVDFLWQDRSGSLWVNSQREGLRRLRDGGFEQISLEGEAKGTGIICMDEDAEGNFWIGTDHGLIQLSRRAVRSFAARDGLPSDNATSICEGKDGVIWVGTDRGLGWISNGIAFTPPGSEAGNSVASVWPRSSGGVWFTGPSRGVHVFRDGQVLRTRTGTGIGLFSALLQDQAGRILVSSDGSVDPYVEDSSGRPEPTGTPLPGKNVGCMIQDHQGTFWFGTAGEGLLRVRGSDSSSFREVDGLSDNRVWSIYEDADHSLWLGTENGLTRYANGKLFVFRQVQGLLENTINCVIEDDAGYLWLSGLHGIHRFKRSELNAVAEGRSSAAQGLTVGTADGMDSPETNGGGQPAGWKASDGRLWFPTIHGVVVIDPKLIPIHEQRPPVVIEQVKADDQSLLTSAVTSAKIPPGRGRVLEFFYTANTFVAPERTRFRYRLLGVDEAWREETTERTARYINLRPGDYRFEVEAKNHHDVWSSQPASFAFTLKPHFWQTWYVFALCCLGAIGVAAAFHGYRLRWQHRLLKLEEQRNLANERTRIARDLHDDLGANVTGIALQLEAARKCGGQNSEQLGLLAEEARSVAHDLRELAWTTNPRCDNSGSLTAFLAEFAERFCQGAGLSCQLELPAIDGTQAVPARVRHELLLVLKESLANVARHAKATSVTVRLSTIDGELRLAIKDDGKGFDASRIAAGSGLRNLEERLSQAGGTFKVETKTGGGTTVVAIVPTNLIAIHVAADVRRL